MVGTGLIVGGGAASAGAASHEVTAIPVEPLTAENAVERSSPATPGGSPAPAPTLAEPSRHDARKALRRSRRLLDGRGVETGREVTLALRDLALAVPTLSGERRREARAILARPTDGAADDYDDGYTVPSFVACSANFCYHWVTATADAPSLGDNNGLDDFDGIPDWIEVVAFFAEQVRGVENGQLGWTFPKSDGGLGGDSRTDIYIMEFSGDLYGYAAPDLGQPSARHQYAYLALDDDYSTSEYGYSDTRDPLAVTLAHEYNHVLQMFYDQIQDDWMFESTATWIEEIVYPSINDYLNYIVSFSSRPGLPITYDDGDKIYGSAVWNHWLSRRFGNDLIRDAWFIGPYTSPADFAVGAYDSELREEGSSFAAEFIRFAIATVEWRARGEFPDRGAYPDVARKGKLKPGRTKKVRLDHTAYALFKVKAKRARKVKLAVKAPKGTVSAIALVGRKGGATDGKVKEKIDASGKGGKLKVTLKKPRKLKRITAVLVNADGRANEYSSSLGDWVYIRDGRKFKVRLRAR